MNQKEERAYERGRRAVLLSQLYSTLEVLGYGTLKRQLVALVREREAAVEALRRVCDVHGDNEWDTHLHLADIIEKHLEKHL